MATNRGRNEGSIYEIKSGRHKGLIGAAVIVDYTPHGKPIRKYKYCKSKAEAKEFILKTKMDLEKGHLVLSANPRLSEFLTQWLENTVAGDVRSTTLHSYESTVRLHILPGIGFLRLKELTPDRLRRHLIDLAKCGVSDRMRNRVHTVLHTALNAALADGLVAFNVCDRVKKPRYTAPKPTVLDPEEILRFLSTSRSDRLHAAYVVAAFTGVRQGELFGLQWGDFSATDRALAIARAIAEVRGTIEIVPPKSNSSYRRIELPQVVVNSLQQHRERMAAEGRDTTNTGWIFCDTEGNLLRKSNFLRRSFRLLQERAGVKRITFHGLRHSHATMLLLSNTNPKIVQERLGHSDIRLTLGTYSHVLPSMQREAAAKVDDLVRQLGGNDLLY